MDDLTPDQSAVLHEILSAPAAWMQCAPLDMVGWGRIVDELVSMELVIIWGHDRHGRLLDGGPFVTLTPIASYRLGMAVIEYSEERPTWGRAEHEPPYVVMPRHPRQRRLNFPELIVDRKIEPEYVKDRVSGEVVRLFAGDGTGGIPIIIDHRLKSGKGSKAANRKTKKARKTA